MELTWLWVWIIKLFLNFLWSSIIWASGPTTERKRSSWEASVGARTDIIALPFLTFRPVCIFHHTHWKTKKHLFRWLLALLMMDGLGPLFKPNPELLQAGRLCKSEKLRKARVDNHDHVFTRVSQFSPEIILLLLPPPLPRSLLALRLPAERTLQMLPLTMRGALKK